MFKEINQGHSSYRGNVMTPLNWFTGITQTVFLPTAAMNRDNWLGIGCFILSVVIIIFYGAIYTFWSWKNPNRLQSEGYNIVTKGLEINPDQSEVDGTNVIESSHDLLE